MSMQDRDDDAAHQQQNRRFEMVVNCSRRTSDSASVEIATSSSISRRLPERSPTPDHVERERRYPAADSRLSVKERPSRTIGEMAEARARSSLFVMASAAISHDSTSVMPPARSVERLLVTCAMASCRSSWLTMGSFKSRRSTASCPEGLRVQM
jgi:hypothetical protein